MLGTSAVEVAVTLAAVYFVFSIIASTIVEWIARRGGWRGKMLRASLGTAIEQQEEGAFLTSLYAHPVISGLDHEDASPSYISSRTFALAILDLGVDLYPPSQNMIGQTQIRTEIRSTAHPLIPIAPSTRRLLETITFGTDGSIGHVQDRIEKWYDELMMRVTGVYARKAKAWTLGIGMVIVVVLNVDTILLIKYLNGHDFERQHFSSVVEAQLTPGMKANEQIAAISAIVLQTPLPLGWCLSDQAEDNVKKQSSSQSIGALLTKLVGLLISAIAISFGAPFWFDLLGKLVNVRQVGIKPESSVTAGV